MVNEQNLCKAAPAIQIARIVSVLPFFAAGELCGLADYLERRAASRFERRPQNHELPRHRRRRTPLPIREDG